jgi:hypothetical protein
VIWRDVQVRVAVCALKVPKLGIFVAEAKLVLARPALDGVVQKSPQKAQKAPLLAWAGLKATWERHERLVQGGSLCRVRSRPL